MAMKSIPCQLSKAKGLFFIPEERWRQRNYHWEPTKPQVLWYLKDEPNITERILKNVSDL